MESFSSWQLSSLHLELFDLFVEEWSSLCCIFRLNTVRYLLPVFPVFAKPTKCFSQFVFFILTPCRCSASVSCLLKTWKKFSTGEIWVLLKLFHQLMRHSAYLYTITIWNHWHNFLPVSPMFANSFSQRRMLLICPSLFLLKTLKNFRTGKMWVLLKLQHQLLSHCANLSTITIWNHRHNFLPVPPMFVNGFFQRWVLFICPFFPPQRE